jgi:lysozyme
MFFCAPLGRLESRSGVEPGLDTEARGPVPPQCSRIVVHSRHGNPSAQASLKNGAEFVGRFEGLRTTPYNDAVGNATIGYGHLIHYGNVTPADNTRYHGFTTAEALTLLEQDAEKAASVVRSISPPITNQAHFDALVSIAFNCGTGVLDSRSSLGAELRKPGRGKAADAFLLYDHAGGVVLEGLQRRREAERRLWLTGKYI